MGWLKVAWRDPVVSKLIVTGILATLGWWKWRHIFRILADTWAFLISPVVVPVWLVAVLGVVALVALAVVLVRAFRLLRGPKLKRVKKLRAIETEILRYLGFFEGSRHLSISEIARATENPQVVIGHAVDELRKLCLIETIFGNNTRYCFLTEAGRAYVVEHDIMPKQT